LSLADDLLVIQLEPSRNKMRNVKLVFAVLIMMHVVLCGCKMAEPNFDETYSTYGGVIQRPDTTIERVNSVLDIPESAPDLEGK
tara:strand:- start:551 stop:802 length:252 start_codon:yes stop_codon:yes gene_type:complete